METGYAITQEVINEVYSNLPLLTLAFDDIKQETNKEQQPIVLGKLLSIVFPASATKEGKKIFNEIRNILKPKMNNCL